MRTMHFDFQKSYAKRRGVPRGGDLGGFWQKYRGPRREVSAPAPAPAPAEKLFLAQRKNRNAHDECFSRRKLVAEFAFRISRMKPRKKFSSEKFLRKKRFFEPPGRSFAQQHEKLSTQTAAVYRGETRNTKQRRHLRFRKAPKTKGGSKKVEVGYFLGWRLSSIRRASRQASTALLRAALAGARSNACRNPHQFSRHRFAPRLAASVGAPPTLPPTFTNSSATTT